MLNDVYDLINEITEKLTLVWIPSHVGIKGNEIADRAALEATRNESVDLEINLELKEINEKITKYIMDKWQTLWNSSIHGSFYRRIEPHVSQKIKFTHQNRSKETTITRLRLGKYSTNEYLAQINVVKSNKCTICGISVETVEHYLLRCPNSELCKQIIHSCCSLKRTLDIESILIDIVLYNDESYTLTRYASL